MGEFEGEFCDSDGSFSGDDFEGFDDSGNALVFDPRVFALRVLTNHHDVQILREWKRKTSDG